jgi:hypothetical protein
MIGDMMKKVKQFYNIISRSLLRHSYNGKISPYVVDVNGIKCDIEVNNTKINQNSI